DIGGPRRGRPLRVHVHDEHAAGHVEPLERLAEEPHELHPPARRGDEHARPAHGTRHTKTWCAASSGMRNAFSMWKCRPISSETTRIRWAWPSPIFHRP